MVKKMTKAIHSLTNALFAAIESNNLEEVNSLIEQGADVNSANYEGETPLMAAVMQNIHQDKFTGEVQIIELLVKKGANVDGTDNFGNTALHFAAAYTKFDYGTFYKDEVPVRLEQGKLVIKLLLESGANPNALNNEGKTPIDFARSAEAIELLLKIGGEFDPNTKSYADSPNDSDAGCLVSNGSNNDDKVPQTDCF
ncbi:MAG: ankyrin repeat protein [Candidatus Midichloriaceae bacterium]|jgi:ankyrin repeat protein|nr:ankyrin repeat protein [Candidatus Midichloriaceae bacterium]